jgi:hypothetical protein
MGAPILPELLDAARQARLSDVAAAGSAAKMLPSATASKYLNWRRNMHFLP